MRFVHLFGLVASVILAADTASAEIIQAWDGGEDFLGSGLRGSYLGYTDRNHPFVFLDGRFSPGVRVYREGHIEYPLAYFSVWPAGTGTTRFNDAQYTMRINLFEVEHFQISHQGFLDFTGRFDGVASPGQVNVAHVFTSPTTQTLVLGSDRFVVSVFPSVMPVGPTKFLDGGAVVPDAANVFARISVNGVEDTPEPSAVVLAVLGLGSTTTCCFRSWSRRSKALAGASAPR